MLSKRPGFAIVAVATLALGIGANTAIFTVVHSVLLQPLHLPKPIGLPSFGRSTAKKAALPASGPELMTIRDRTSQFEDLGGIWAQSGALTGEGEPEHVKLGMVTASFLGILGTRPQLGRLFLPSEEGPGAPFVAILSDGLGRRRYGADPHLVGPGRAPQRPAHHDRWRHGLRDSKSFSPKAPAFRSGNGRVCSFPFPSRKRPSGPKLLACDWASSRRRHHSSAQQEMETIAAHLARNTRHSPTLPLAFKSFRFRRPGFETFVRSFWPSFGGAAVLVLYRSTRSVANLLLWACE